MIYFLIFLSGVQVVVLTIENGGNFVFGCVLVFSFCFLVKSGTTINHRTGLNDILYLSFFSRDSKHSKNFKKIPSVVKNRFEIFNFSS